MAVKFDTAGEYLSRTGFVTATAWTMACWVRVDTDTNTYQAIFGAMSATTPGAFMTTNSDGTTFMYADLANADTVGDAMSIGAWYYVAATWNGTTLTLYKSPGLAAFSTWTGTSHTTDSGWNFFVAAADHQFIDPSGAGLRGTVAHGRVWTAALSQAQLEAERAAAAAVRTSNLWADWTLLDDANDDSGNSRNLTTNGTVAYVTGPLNAPFVVTANGAALTTNDPAVTFTGYVAVEDDLVILFPSSATVLGAVANASLPAGWINPLGDGVEINSDAHGMACFAHFVTAAEEAAVTTTYTATNALDAAETGYTQGVIVRGVDTTTPIDSANTAQDSANTVTPHVLASLTGTNLSDDSLVVSSVAKDATGAYSTQPTGWTFIRQDNTNNGRATLIRDALTVAGTNVTATNITPSAGDEYVSITLALTKAAAVVPDVAGSPTVVTAVSATAGIGTQADVAPTATRVTAVSATASLTATGQLAPAATVVTAVSATAALVGHATVTANATVVTAVSATASLGSQADVAASATVVTAVSATANVAGGTVPDVLGASTVVTAVSATASIAGTAGVTPAATVVGVVSATVALSATANVGPAATVVTAISATATLGAQADIAPTGTVVAAASATADIVPGSVTIIDPVPTFAVAVSAIANVAGTAAVGPTGTVVTAVSPVATIGGHASVAPAATIVAAFAVIAQINELARNVDIAAGITTRRWGGTIAEPRRAGAVAARAWTATTAGRRRKGTIPVASWTGDIPDE